MLTKSGALILKTAKRLLASGEPQLALERLKQVLAVADGNSRWKVLELIGAAYHDLGNAAGVAGAYFEAARHDTILRFQRAHWSNYIFALHYLPTVDAEILWNVAQIYGSLYRDVEPLKLLPRKAGKIRVAYIAPHFLDSAAARFYEALLTGYDREKFYVTAWSLSGRADSFTEKIRRSVDGYFDISETSFEEAAQAIRDGGADILFDLGGHTEGGVTLQIAAYRPARVQISGVGYFDTTGLDAIDYFLTDDFLAGSRSRFSEKILAVDDAFAFTPSEKMIRAEKNLNRRVRNFTYGCLNNFMKITGGYLSGVKKILAENPGAKIIFRDTTPLESRRKVLLERIAEAGIEPERVDVRTGADDFLSDYAAIDMILDTAPYNGGMMTALALYMGVAVSTRAGELHHSRIGADLVRIHERGALFDTKNFVAKVYDKLAEIV